MKHQMRFSVKLQRAVTYDMLAEADDLPHRAIRCGRHYLLSAMTDLGVRVLLQNCPRSATINRLPHRPTPRLCRLPNPVSLQGEYSLRQARALRMTGRRAGFLVRSRG